jgi:short-subunit dehydrogenase
MNSRISTYYTDKGWEFPYLRVLREPSKDEQDYFQNKVVVVTGASSGIGRAIAREFAERRAIVALASRNEGVLKTLAAEIRSNAGTAMAFPTDVSDEEQCKSLIEETVNTFGKIDILVNNAGISMRANFQDVGIDVLKRIMNTNFWGTVYCTKSALPHILKQKGSVVGISSICGITPLPGRTGYAASKHAMNGFLESLRLENNSNDLHVMLVHPGFTTSNIRNVALNSLGEPQIEIPLVEEKLMPAERVAKEAVSGIVYRKKNITLTTEGRLITWIYRHMPNLADRLIYGEMKKENGSPF